MPISRSQMERQLRMGGGIMGLEPRQQYGLGSFVKKAVKGVTGAVKSIAKSDLGKAALLYAGTAGLGSLAGGGGLSSLFKLGTYAPSAVMGSIPGIFSKKGISNIGGSIFGNKLSSAIGNNAGMIGATVLGGVLGALSPQEQEEISGSGGTNVEALRSKLTKAYTDLQYDPAKIPDLVANDLSEYTQDMNRTGAMYGGRIGYAEGSEDMILPMRKPEIEEMISSNPGAAESGNPISRNNPVANLIDKYNTYKKAMPGVADETKTYLIEDFKKSLEDSGISIEEFNMRLQEQNEMDEPVDMAYGGRMGYSDGTDFENYLKGREQFEREQSEEQLYREYLEDKRRQKIAEQRNMVAYGGRMGYAFGTPEQNAIQAAQMEGLPLNQNPAGVTELDLRNSGGFIPPVGVKEKADDIPAMLANNEFVFTADAVRGMGDGNVNKGAQRMYDMMKKLEKGGRV
jgi:hypothetical protein